jgi:hypothetical protein
MFFSVCIPVAHAGNLGYQTRPIYLGVSGGNPSTTFSWSGYNPGNYCSYGTLGALVADNNGNQYVLSNSHVLAEGIRISAPVVSSLGSEITQPGPGILNGGNCFPGSSYDVANLTAWVPLLFDGSYNPVDAAIAKVIAGRVRTDGQIQGIGPVSSAPANPKKGLKVQKSGATTGVTKGKIIELNKTVFVNVCEGTPSSTSTCDAWGYAKFPGQLVISGTGFSAPGDSGSLIVTTGA